MGRLTALALLAGMICGSALAQGRDTITITDSEGREVTVTREGDRLLVRQGEELPPLDMGPGETWDEHDFAIAAGPDSRLYVAFTRIAEEEIPPSAWADATPSADGVVHFAKILRADLVLSSIWSLTQRVTRLWVYEWDAQAWTRLGSVVCECPESTLAVTIAVDPEGRPVVAWRERDGTFDASTEWSYQVQMINIAVSRWEDGAWRNLAMPFPALPAGGMPSLEFDAEGRLVVRWDPAFDPTGQRHYAMRLDGDAWEMIGTQFTPPTLLDLKNRPFGFSFGEFFDVWASPEEEASSPN